MKEMPPNKEDLNMFTIIDQLNAHHLKRHTGDYNTFDFREGKYRFQLNRLYCLHSTGRILRIFIVAPDGDTMLIYDKYEWYGSSYHHNGFGDGWVSGPWVKEVKDLFARFKGEIEEYKFKRMQENEAERKRKEDEETTRINKFASLCNDEDQN